MTSRNASRGTPAICERFSAPDSDITIKSSDGILFKLHKLNLTMSLGNWEIGKPSNEDQIVQLSEDSKILELLFQFCYPECHPDLETLRYPILARLTKAVEKYNVFSAILIGRIRMRDTLPHEAFDIFLYAANHNYTDITDKAAPLVALSTPSSTIVPVLPTHLQRCWLLYHERWLRVLQDALSSYDTSALPKKCSSRGCTFEACSTHILRRLSVGLGSLKDLDVMFEPSETCCSSHKVSFFFWRQSLEESIQKMPSFKTFTTQAQDLRFALPSFNMFYPQGPVAVSTRFCAPDSDVTFQSSDWVLFKIHKINLKVHTGGFAPPTFDACDKTVQLTEASTTLDLLFRFCYPGNRPDVEKLPFDDLVLLAEAAEKYQVYPLMNMCKICMKQQLPQHAMPILSYAARHDYSDIVDIAAPLVVVRLTLSETLPILPSNFIMPWVEYFETVHPNTMDSRLEDPFPKFSAVQLSWQSASI